MIKKIHGILKCFWLQFHNLKYTVTRTRAVQQLRHHASCSGHRFHLWLGTKILHIAQLGQKIGKKCVNNKIKYPPLWLSFTYRTSDIMFQTVHNQPFPCSITSRTQTQSGISCQEADFQFSFFHLTDHDFWILKFDHKLPVK